MVPSLSPKRNRMKWLHKADQVADRPVPQAGRGHHNAVSTARGVYMSNLYDRLEPPKKNKKTKKQKNMVPVSSGITVE